MPQTTKVVCERFLHLGGVDTFYRGGFQQRGVQTSRRGVIQQSLYRCLARKKGNSGIFVETLLCVGAMGGGRQNKGGRGCLSFCFI